MKPRFRSVKSFRNAIGFVIFALAQPWVCLRAKDARQTMTPITKAEVHEVITVELRARGTPADRLPQRDAIELPAAVPAAVPRALHVAGACWNATLGQVQFRIACRNSECLPFFAYVRIDATAWAKSIGPACASMRAGHTQSRQTAVRAGDRATVVYYNIGMRLTAAVTCLERGAEGDVIRVRNQDGYVFRARVATATLLEALTE
ncbi:MAG TPA: flagella basal body P-ring formation protein FlgA [Terriglobales bacterium]|nr:flagella basal body P-ring formation protein FlgA [Terriglobales bacterium]